MTSYNLNIKRLFIIENIYIPIFNSLHPRKPFNLLEFENIIYKVSKLNIGISSVEFYNEKLQKYKPYNLDISKMVLKKHTEYNKIKVRIEKLNELYPEKISHLAIEFEIPDKILIEYKNSIFDNQKDIKHSENNENNLLINIKIGNQDALKTLINLYKNEILHISKKYIKFNVNSIQECIYSFCNVCKIYNKEKHGKFREYALKWMNSFVNQAAQESLRLKPLKGTL
jgi:hypothetical protein